MQTVSYTPGFAVVWRGHRSHWYLMNKALELAKRMRKRGHSVIVTRRSKAHASG